MPSSNKNNQLTTTQILVPVSLIAFTLTLLFAFQTSQILRDRDSLNLAKIQQEKPYEDSQRLQLQLQSLVLGTQKLADQGDENAKVIVNKLKDLGISIAPPAQKTVSPVIPAPIPAATEKKAPGPVKP
jgi:hypothetical protein